MKKLLVAILFIITFTLSSCELPNQNEEGPKLEDIEVSIQRDFTKTFEVGDEIPDFSTYFIIGEDPFLGAYTTELKTPFTSDTFLTEGTFIIELVFTLEDDSRTESFTIIVNEEQVQLSNPYFILSDQLRYEYQLGEQIPNIENYMTMLEHEAIVSYDITSPFPNHIHSFISPGEYVFTIIVYLNDETTFEVTLTFTVVGDIDYTNNLEWLFDWMYRQDFQKIKNENQVVYNTDQYYDSNYQLSLLSNSTYPYGLSHEIAHYNLNGNTDTIEIYMELNPNQIQLHTKSNETNQEWVTTTPSLDDLLEERSKYGTKGRDDVLYGQGRMYAQSETEDTLEFELTLSDYNFDFQVALPIVETIGALGIGDINDLDYLNSLSDYFDLISLTIITNLECSRILSMTYDYTDFLNAITDTVEVEQAIFREYDFDFEEFEQYVHPEILYPNYYETSTTFYDLGDKEILDSVVDPINQILYYTIKDSHDLYRMDLTTLQTSFISFDLYPEHLYFQNGKVYTSLFKGEHNYYDWPLFEQYGGFAVVESSDFTLLNTFDIAIDPADFVVDTDGYIYFCLGSNQERRMYSYNTETGEQVDLKLGSYFDGDLIYSPYNNHIYYTNNHSTDTKFYVLVVEEGIFVDSFTGQDADTHDTVTINQAGTEIHSGNGTVFIMGETWQNDTRIDYNRSIDFRFKTVAFDFSDTFRYVTINNAIVQVDDYDAFKNAYGFSIQSKQLFYLDDMLVNVFQNGIELISLDTETPKLDTMYTVINVGSEFDPTTLLPEEAEYTLIDGTYDGSQIGTYVLTYQITKLDGVSVDFLLNVVVSIYDNVPPVISVVQDTYEITVGNTFIPDQCTAYDEMEGQVDCVIESNTVDSEQIGTYYVTYKAKDQFNNQSIYVVEVHVLLEELDYTFETITFPTTVTDVVFDHNNNRFYYVDFDQKQVVRYNYVTEESVAITFDDKVEHLVLDGDRLYVSIYYNHDPYLDLNQQSGKIAVIDTTQFVVLDLFEIEIDPYQLLVYNNYLYIGPGSGQFVPIHIYDKSTYELIGTTCQTRYQSIITVDPFTGDIINTAKHSGNYLEVFKTFEGACVGIHDTRNSVEEKAGTRAFVTPWKDYYIGQNGNVFVYYDETDSTPLEFAFSLGFDVHSVQFDVVNNIVYYSTFDKAIYISKKDQYGIVQSISLPYVADQFYVDEQQIYFFQYQGLNQQMVFVIATEVIE